jgi:hypothetical protein
LCQIKDYKIGICSFSAKRSSLASNNTVIYQDVSNS